MLFVRPAKWLQQFPKVYFWSPGLTWSNCEKIAGLTRMENGSRQFSYINACSTLLCCPLYSFFSHIYRQYQDSAAIKAIRHVGPSTYFSNAKFYTVSQKKTKTPNFRPYLRQMLTDSLSRKFAIKEFTEKALYVRHSLSVHPVILVQQ